MGKGGDSALPPGLEHCAPGSLEKLHSQEPDGHVTLDIALPFVIISSERRWGKRS